MDAFPAYFPLRDRVVVIVGDGEAAEAKLRLFKSAPATIRRLTGEAGLDPQAYAGAALAFIAGGEQAYLEAAAGAARQAGVPVNVGDRPALCDFTTPAVVDRGEVVAAIGTGGASPMLASLLRHDIETRVPEGAGRVAALFRLSQDRVRAALPDLARRRGFLRAALTGAAAQAAMAGDLARAHQLLDEALAAHVAGGIAAGRVLYLEARGPADLITLRAAAALAQADALVIDPGSDEAVLDLARRDAHRLEAGATSAEALICLAMDGLQVVRLVTGPAAAEQTALTAGGVRFEILPIAAASA